MRDLERMKEDIEQLQKFMKEGFKVKPEFYKFDQKKKGPEKMMEKEL